MFFFVRLDVFIVHIVEELISYLSHENEILVIKVQRILSIHFIIFSFFALSIFDDEQEQRKYESGILIFSNCCGKKMTNSIKIQSHFEKQNALLEQSSVELAERS